MGGVITAILNQLGLAEAGKHHRRRSSASSNAEKRLTKKLMEEVLRIQTWDEGLIHQSLVRNKVWPRALDAKAQEEALGFIVPATRPDNQLKVGTYRGTCKALTQVLDLVEKR